MQRIFLLICINAVVFLFLGIFWYYPIMPFLFYNTIADSEMQQQMDGDLIQFYALVDEISQLASRGMSLSERQKIVLVFTPGGEYGFLLWPLFGGLLGLGQGMSSQFRLRKSLPVTASF